MDARIVFVAVAVIVFVLGLVTGLWGWLVQFFFANPFLLVAVMIAVAGFLAYRSGHSAVALASVGLVLISISVDFYYPPVSALCTQTDGSAQMYLENYPESAFASDSALCWAWIKNVGFNPAFTFELGSPINGFWLLAPFFVLLEIVLLCLALFVSPRFWVGVGLAISLAIIYFFLFPDLVVSSFGISLAGIIAYGVVAPIFFVVGNLLLPFGEEGASN